MPTLYNVLDDFIGKAAESLDLPEGRYRATEEVIEAAEEYESAVEDILLAYIEKSPLSGKTVEKLTKEDQLNALMDRGDAAYNILLMLVNNTDGIMDGCWKKFFDNDSELETIKNYLKSELEDFVDGDGGGFLWEVFETTAESQGEKFEYRNYEE